MSFDTLLKKSVAKMRKQKHEIEPEAVTTTVVDEDAGSGSEEIYTDDEECSSIESEPDEEHRKFKAFLQQKAREQADFAIDFDVVLDKLEIALPPIPGRP